MYIILCRYQYWGPEGITWTRWYIYDYNISDKVKGEARVSELIENSKKDKLQQEYLLLTESEIDKYNVSIKIEKNGRKHDSKAKV